MEAGFESHQKSPRIETDANFYDRLGVGQQASDQEVDRAYRRLVMKHHPDRGGDTLKMQLLNEARDTLLDPARRAQYSPPQDSKPNQKTEHEPKPSTNTSTRGTESRRTSTEEDFSWEGFSAKPPPSGFRSERGSRSHFEQTAQREEDPGAKEGSADNKKETGKERGPETIEQRAANEARAGAHLYQNFINSLKRNGTPNAEDLIRSPEVIRVVLEESVSKAQIHPSFYGTYVNSWVQNAGFDQQAADTNPALLKVIHPKSLYNANLSPRYFSEYLNEWHKYNPHLKEEDIYVFPELIEFIKTSLIERIKLAPHYFSAYLKEWEKYNPYLNRKELVNAPKILALIKERAEKQKILGKDAYSKYLAEFEKEGVDTSKLG